MSNIWEDSRFSNLIRDARFKNLPNFKKRTKIDKRFKPMFDEVKFKSKQGIDKYGRPIRSSTSDDLKKFYDLNSDENDDSDQEAEKEAILEEKAIEKDNDENNDHAGDELSNDGIILTKELKKKLRADIDFARGEAQMFSDSSSEEEEESEEEDSNIEHEFWGELDNNIEEIDESTTRLAVCNMDWEQIKAPDIMVLMHSFLPVGGAVLSVKVLVSEFGKKCLKEEEVKGPLEIIKLVKKDRMKLEISDNEESEEEGDFYHTEKLRQYQINKLKYYYAVVTCDSKESAEKLYEECDGLEYETTSTKMDLRFIPEDMSFADEDIREECTDLPQNMSNYKPNIKPVDALHQAKVKVTWDETAIERKEIFDKLSSGKYDDLSSFELKKFINCSDEENSNDEVLDKITEVEQKTEDNLENLTSKNSISKYKLLLEEINDKDKLKNKSKYEMEYSWGIDISKDQSATNHESDSNDSDDIPSDVDMNDPYFAEEIDNSKIKKGKTKKNNRIIDEIDNEKTNELKLLLNDYSDENESKKRASKKNKRKNTKGNQTKEKVAKLDSTTDDNFQVDPSDKRFENIYTTTAYSIDPNNPRFKKTLGMDNIIQEKIKRRHFN